MSDNHVIGGVFTYLRFDSSKPEGSRLYFEDSDKKTFTVREFFNAHPEYPKETFTNLLSKLHEAVFAESMTAEQTLQEIQTS